MAFQLNLPIETLRGRRLFVATPMYGGNCNGTYARSMIDLAATCARFGIELQLYYLFNESLIQRARNYAAHEFVTSTAEHMMFIDADIDFNPMDIIALMAMQIQDPGKYSVICGPYPKKTICWEKIVAAVDAGLAKENPNNLENYVGDYVFNPITMGETTIPLNEPVRVLEAGTGFMMIERDTFTKFAEAYPEMRYRPDHIRTAKFDGSQEITAFFHCIIDPESKRYLSEDYFFCQYVQKAGLDVWLCPWMKLKHTGSYVFGGSLADLAVLGASPTADPSLLNKEGK